ncbi:MAG TPA: hypothetical protein PLU22_11300 [Polyangiaceae bacterium]|nr:hypothetical protein [Polyangiaceae bacterium]
MVDTERFALVHQVRLPIPEPWELHLTANGRALVFGADSTGEPPSAVAIVEADGQLRREELGAERALRVRADDRGPYPDTVFLDDQRDTFVRFLVPEPTENFRHGRAELETRPIAADSAAKRSRVRLPAWFDGGVLGCHGGLCVLRASHPRATDTMLMGRLGVVDVRTGRAQLLPNTVLGYNCGIAFAADGRVAVQPGAGADPILIEPRTWRVRPLGRPAKDFSPMHAAGCLAFSSDGALLATASEYEPVMVFEVASGRRRWPPPAVDCSAEPASCPASVAHWESCGVAFTQGDGAVVDHSELGSAQKLDVVTGKIRGPDLGLAWAYVEGRAVGNEEWATGGILSPLGGYFLAYDPKTGITLLDVRTWTRLPSTGITKFARVGAFSPDDRFLIVTNRVWDLARGTFVATLP